MLPAVKWRWGIKAQIVKYDETIHSYWLEVQHLLAGPGLLLFAQ